VHDIVTFLRGFPPFDTADMQALDKVARTVTIEFFGQDAAILNGNATEDAYVIRTGQVELLDDNGIVDVLGPGELVGLPSLLTDMPAGLSTRAAEDVLAYRIPADVLVPLLADRSGLRFVAQHVAQRADETTTRQQAADVTAARVATYARPVVIVPGDEPLKDVIHKMREAGASSALVSGPPEGSWGIITDRDLRDRVLAQGVGLDAGVAIAATFPARTVDPMLPVGQAILEMLSRGIHHLPVLTPEGEPLGMVEDIDLLNAQSHTPLHLRRAIARAQNPIELAELSDQVRMAALDAQRSGRAAPEVTALISLLADAITERALELHTADRDRAPVQFAWVNTGSVARGEAVLSSDLDNLIVWEGEDRDPQIRAWMNGFAADVIGTLEQCGLAHDTNGVRADDPRFARSADAWITAVDQWAADPTQNQGDVYLSTLADARPITSEQVLRPVRTVVLERLQTPLVRRTLQRVATSRRPPTGFIRDFVIDSSGEHKGTLGIKAGGTEIITTIARFSATMSRSHALGTRERLRFAAAVGVLDPEDTADLIDAFEFLQGLRLEHQLEQVNRGEEPDDFLDPRHLSGLNRRHLRNAFRVLSRVQSDLPGIVRRLPT